MIRRLLLASALLLPVSASSLTTNFSVTIANPSQFKVGQNIGYVLAYWTNYAMYADVMLQTSANSGPWDATSFASGTAATLDATGAPTVTAETAFTATYETGNYALSWDGTGTVTMRTGCSQGSTSSAGGHNTATVTCTQQVPTDTSSPAYNIIHAVPPVTNIHLMAPAATGMFTTNFINKMSSYDTIRAMWQFNTPGNYFNQNAVNPVSNWSDRTFPASGSRAAVQGGMAYEDLIALANQTNKAIWINIPIMATDDYVCRVARLFAFGEQQITSPNASCNPAAAPGTATTAVINSTSTIYVEEGNEMWNAVYPLYDAVNCWGNNGVPASGRTCTGGTVPPSAVLATAVATPAWINFVAADGIPYGGEAAGMLLSKRNHDIFAAVFNQLSRGSQIKVVLGVQSNNVLGNFTMAHLALDFLNTNYGAPSSWSYAFATAPYITLSNPAANKDNVDAIFADINAQLTNPGSKLQQMQDDFAEAAKWSLTNVCYESGQSLDDGGGATGTASEITAVADPRFATVYVNYYSLWRVAAGGTPTLCNHYSGFAQFWGALPSTANVCSQRWMVLMAMTSGTPCTPP